jgi:transposase-like protein
MEKEKKMYALIAQQEQSGETVKAFAQKHGISCPTWYKWRKKYRRGGADCDVLRFFRDL